MGERVSASYRSGALVPCSCPGAALRNKPSGAGNGMHSGGCARALVIAALQVLLPLTGLGRARPHNGLQRLDGEGGQHVSLEAFGAKDACETREQGWQEV